MTTAQERFAELQTQLKRSTDEVAEAAAAVYGLNPSERAVLRYVIDGEANRQIAGRCGFTEKSVKHHLYAICQKMKVSKRGEVVAHLLGEALMGRTSIEWCDYSLPIVNGCRRISPGCENCYAERLVATRLSKTPKYGGLAIFKPGHGPRWTGEARLWLPDLDAPLRVRTPSKFFVADMGDLFYDEVPDEVIDQVFGMMWACLYLGPHAIPGHIFQILTKRGKRLFAYMSQDRRKKWAEQAVAIGGGRNPDLIYDQVLFHKGPHPRIWVGVSVENQKYADERIPFLLGTPAAVRFVSAEPLLGPVDLKRYLDVPEPIHDEDGELDPHATFLMREAMAEGRGQAPRRLSWVIVGGESGPGARPVDVQWIRNIVAECQAAKVAVFVKQLGVKPGFKLEDEEQRGNPLPSFHHYDAGSGLHIKAMNHRKGGDPAEWPEELRVRQFPLNQGSV